MPACSRPAAVIYKIYMNYAGIDKIYLMKDVLLCMIAIVLKISRRN